MTGFILGFEFINNYFKPLLLIAASCFAIYFAIQKFGNKVIARFEVSLGLFSSDYISNIVLTNKKDKTISIWSIHAVFENDLRLELDKFSPPIVLKSHETVGLSMPKFSSLNVNGDDYTPEYIFGNVSIFLDAGDRLIKCQEDGKKNILSCFTEIKKYRAVFATIKYLTIVFHLYCPTTMLENPTRLLFAKVVLLVMNGALVQITLEI